MLHKKLKIEWDVLQVEKKNFVKNFLFNALIHFSKEGLTNTNIKVVERVCMCFGMVVSRIVAEDSSVLQTLMNSIPANLQLTRFCLVQILSSVVEEIEVFGMERGRMVAANLLKSETLVLQFLKQVASKPFASNENAKMETLIRKSSVLCISKWISLGVEIEVLYSLDIFNFLFSLSKSADLFVESLECLSALFSSPHIFHSPTSPMQGRLMFEKEEHKKAIQLMVLSINEMEKLFDKLSAEPESETNFSIIEAISKLAVAIAEANIRMLLHVEDKSILALLNFLVKCTASNQSNVRIPFQIIYTRKLYFQI